MEIKNLSELETKLSATKAEVKSIFDAHRDSDGQIRQVPAADLSSVEQKNKEIADLQSEIAELKASTIVRPAIPTVDGDTKMTHEIKSIGTQLIENGRQSGAYVFDFKANMVETKANFTTSAGLTPEIVRSGDVQFVPTRKLRLFDVLNFERSNDAGYKYLKQTITAMNAAEIAEAGAFGEANFTYADATVMKVKVGTHVPLSDEAKRRNDKMRELVDGELIKHTMLKCETQLFNGTGLAGQMTGVGAASGIQTLTRGTDSHYDAIARAIALIKTNGEAEASHVAMNPMDVLQLRIAQGAAGQYLYDSVANGYNVTSLLGLVVVESTAIPQGTAYIWANEYLKVPADDDLYLEYGYAGTDFTSGLSRVRVDFSLAPAVLRPTAFVKATL